jgi:hypothetical protein
MRTSWQETCDSGHFCHSYPGADARILVCMLLITCPVTRTDELVADRHIRSVVNHPTHIALHVECPACGAVHVYRTGRRWEQARTRVTDRAAAQSAVAAAAATARAARAGVHA